MLRLKKILLIATIIAFAPFKSWAADVLEINVQSRYSPLQFIDSAFGGAHPIGGPGHAFVLKANDTLSPLGINFVMHNSGKVNKYDEKNILPKLVDRKKHGNLYKAVALGDKQGGINAALSIPAESGLAFGEMLSGGVPFGMSTDEYAAYIYYGGGLDLQQKIYDDAFDSKLVTIPVALTSAQGSGFFPKQLPDPDNNPSLSNEDAMAEFCNMPLIVRWPDSAAQVIKEACSRVGVTTAYIGKETRCVDPKATCDPIKNPSNPVKNIPTVLTFGGFAPGVIPHQMFGSGNIDAFELNMPTEDIQFLKLASKQLDKKNADADLSSIVAPYKYAGSWHQPILLVELVFNRDFWDGFTKIQQDLIKTVAQASIVDTQARLLSMQGEAIEQLEAAGVVHLKWPQGILEKLRDAMPDGLNKVANKAVQKGDNSSRLWLDATWAFQKKNQKFFDYGDINQGQSNFQTSKK
ncbi:hypothetical protein GCM10009133_19010 [Cocleimonas flava]|uniref:TRAP-type C4-dicarboxylate transport system substrate-binding protein n=1 Tax=Cocleimonas flava TaxID=634765 RepID=A0A4V2P889_9GAMM|nr:hypothetical protein [Cocleimonas flava]TCJ84825.1 hypothetical protein EV695_2787 [Cocleimonas flava]